MEFPQVGPTIIYEDNTSTIQMLEGAYNHKASKHVNPRYYFSKSAIVDGKVSVEHLVTTEMKSDKLTKALPIHSHWKFAQKVMNFSLNKECAQNMFSVSACVFMQGEKTDIFS
jgi:hypothetical protein